MRAPAAPLVGCALLALCAACSAVVDPDDVPLRCAVSSEGNPCPRGMTCVEGTCRSRSGGTADACPGGDEICNGIDDDCDGLTDEGHDGDLDGFTWCGGGIMERADCDDRTGAAHPGDPDRGIEPATEVCDGVDNDCDGVADESASSPLCPEGQECIAGSCVDPTDCTLPGVECDPGFVCDVTTEPPRCVAGDDCREVGCTAGQICDETTGNCVSPRPLGAPCRTDSECDGGYCAARGVIGASAARAERVCVKACCDDGDCPSGAICYAPGNGAKVCVPPTLLDLQSGPGGPLASCSSGAECASGICGSTIGCVATCSGDAVCGSGNRCAVVQRADDNVQLSCYPGRRGGGAGHLCGDGGDCDVGICYWFVCSGACGTTADCPEGMFCSWQSVEGDSVQVCRPPGLGQGGKRGGESCRSNRNCRDFACVEGTCWDTCCNDSHCGGEPGSCRAVRRGESRYEMHCRPT